MIQLKYDDSNFISTFSAQNIPIAYAECGELIEIQTARPGISEADIRLFNEGKKNPKRILRIVGPLFIQGIKRGDIIKVSIHSINVDPVGKSWFGPWIGLLKDQLYLGAIKEYDVSDNRIKVSDIMSLDIKPMIGTLGTTPLEDVSCLSPGEHGGNMDIPTLAEGSHLYLKSFIDGALLAVGDVHARMGYGEVVGTGIEIGSKVVLSVTKCRDNLNQFPLLENCEYYEIVYSGSTYKSTIENVVKKAISFLEERNNISFAEAYFLVGEFCDLLLTQVVNPSITAVVRIPKEIVKRLVG